MKKILYLKVLTYKTYVKHVQEEEEITSLYSYLHRLANIHLFSIEDYRRQVQKRLKITHQIPIYFSSKLLLFSLRDNKKYQYWINYYMIRNMYYEKGSLFLIFVNEEKLVIDLSKAKVQRILTKVCQLIDYINNI